MAARLAFTASILLLTTYTAAADITIPFTLVRRQLGGIGNIPSQCNSACAPIMSTVSACQDLSCLCNDATALQISSCIDCIAAISPGNAAGDQSLIDEYTNACSTSGQPVSSIAVTPISPAASGSGSSTANSSPSGSAANSASSSSATSGSGNGTSSSGAAGATSAALPAFVMMISTGTLVGSALAAAAALVSL